MRTTDRIDAALAEVAREVADRLVGEGWALRPFGRAGGTLTVPTGDGVVATVALHSPITFGSGEVPVRFRVRLGVGLEAALALAPLLTVEPGHTIHELNPPAEPPAASSLPSR